MSARKYVNRFVLAYGSLSVRSSKLKVIGHLAGAGTEFERVKGLIADAKKDGWQVAGDEARREGKKGGDIVLRPPSCAISPVSRGWSARSSSVSEVRSRPRIPRDIDAVRGLDAGTV
jgi:hypothetical protein